MGEDHEVQALEVDAGSLNVPGEDGRIVSDVEKNPLASVFHQRGVAPILGHRRWLPERVIEDGDAVSSLYHGSAEQALPEQQRENNEKRCCNSSADARTHRISTTLGGTANIRSPTHIRELLISMHE